MAIQMHEPPSNKKQGHKQTSWVLWTVVSVIILVIIAFTVAAFLILRYQAIAQGISTLTIISIVIGVVIGLLGLMISFLQWHHPKPHAPVVHQVQPVIAHVPTSQPLLASSTLPNQISYRRIASFPPLTDARAIQQREQVVKAVYTQLTHTTISALALIGIGGSGKSRDHPDSCVKRRWCEGVCGRG